MPPGHYCLQLRCAGAKETQEKIDVDDVSRSYVVHLPKGDHQQQHYPVVILLHARNQDADDMARLTHFNQLADKDGIIAIYPNATRGQWNIGVRAEQPSAGNTKARRRNVAEDGEAEDGPAVAEVILALFVVVEVIPGLRGEVGFYPGKQESARARR